MYTLYIISLETEIIFFFKEIHKNQLQISILILWGTRYLSASYMYVTCWLLVKRKTFLFSSYITPPEGHKPYCSYISSVSLCDAFVLIRSRGFNLMRPHQKLISNLFKSLSTDWREIDELWRININVFVFVSYNRL